MFSQWTHNIQLRFWETVIELLPRVKSLVKLIWSIYHTMKNRNLSLFLLKTSVIAIAGFLTGSFLYVISYLIR